MKRIGLILLGLTVLLASFCGCDAKETQKTSATTTTTMMTTTTTATTATTTVTITVPSDKQWRLRSVSIEADDIFYSQGTPNYQFCVIQKGEKYGIVDFEGTVIVPIEYPAISLREIAAHIPITVLTALDYPDAWHFEADGTVSPVEYDAWGYTDGYDVYWYNDAPVLSCHDEFIQPFTYKDYVELTDPRRSLGSYVVGATPVLAIREIVALNETPEYSEPMVEKLSDNYALFDAKKQTLITDFIYEDYAYIGFVDGLAAVKKNGKWGYIREDGTAVTEFIYDAVYEDPWMGAHLYSVTNGYIVVRRGDKYGLIDKRGKTIIEPIYEDITAVTDKGLFWLKKDGVWHVGEIL